MLCIEPSIIVSVKRNDPSARRLPSPSGDEPFRDRPSKSQLKREMTALQELGEELLRLPPAKLRALPLPRRRCSTRSNSRSGSRRAKACAASASTSDA